jgi:NAD dependent epimerase/dehydratase family enzyme
MSWIHIEDLVSLLLFASRNMGKTFNGTAPHPVTNREFTTLLGQNLKRPTVFPVPTFGLRMLYGEMANETLLSSAKVLPKTALDLGFEFRYPKLGEALHQLLRSSE